MPSPLTDSAITLEALWIYPIKSARGIAVKTATLTPQGLAHDRRWMLVSREGRFLTQRELPAMTQLEVSLAPDKLLCHYRESTLEIPFLSAAPSEKEIRVWRFQGMAWRYPEPVNSWFSNVLETPCELVYMPDTLLRETNPAYAPGKQVSFADGYPYLLTHQASLEHLNHYLTQHHSAPVTMEYFRPNLVLKSHAAAYAEDHWKGISLSGMDGSTFAWDIVKPCERCVIVNTDPHTGTRRPEILKGLAQTHLHQHKIIFGQNACAKQHTGLLHVGMKGFAYVSD